MSLHYYVYLLVCGLAGCLIGLLWRRNSKLSKKLKFAEQFAGEMLASKEKSTAEMRTVLDQIAPLIPTPNANAALGAWREAAADVRRKDYDQKREFFTIYVKARQGGDDDALARMRAMLGSLDLESETEAAKALLRECDLQMQRAHLTFSTKMEVPHDTK